MTVYTEVPVYVLIGYIAPTIIAFWAQSGQRRERFHWYIFVSLLWGISSVLLNSDFQMENKLAFCKINIVCFMWVAVQFYSFSRSYGHGSYTWFLGGGYFLLVFVTMLSLLDFIPINMVINTGVRYSVGNWLIIIFGALGALTVENIRAQALAIRKTSEPIQKKRNIFIIIGICIMFLFTIPTGFVEYSHLTIAHIGNLMVVFLWTYVVVGLGEGVTEETEELDAV